MADAVVGALRVTLGADTAEFETALEGAAAQFEKWGKQLGGVAGVAAAAFATAAATIAVSLQKTINQIEELGKTSEKIGVPVEELSALQHAANLADVSTEQLGSSMVKLAKNMSAVAGGAEGPASKAFEVLNVQVTKADGSLRDSSDIIAELSKKFSGFQDSAEKTALAVAIFGKSGAEMIPFLNQGADGLAKATEEAQRFGLVLSTETVEAARQFNDDMKRLGAIQQGIWTQITADALPALTRFSEALVALASNSQFAEAAMKIVNAIIREISLFVVEASAAFAGLARSIELVTDVFKAARNFSLDEMKAAWDRYTAASEAADKATREVIASLNEEGSELDAVVKAWGALERAQENAAKTKAPIIQSEKDHKSAIDQFIESTQKSIISQQAELAAIGQHIGVRERLRIIMQGEEIARQNNISLSERQRAQLQALGEQGERTAQQIAGKRLIEDSLPLWEQYQKKIEDNRLALESLGATAEQVAKVNQKTAEQMGFTWDQTATSTLKGWGNALDTMAKENKKFATAAKALAIAQALISTYTGAAKALEIGFPPFNFIAAAGVIAAGLAYVASIAGVQFAKGGSFRVGGGLTGVDSEMVAFRATPGEMVDVRRPGQAGGGGPTTINLTMTPRADQFFASHVREMVYALNKAAPDGYVLKVKPA